jgi:small subunit ribosomal protein S2
MRRWRALRVRVNFTRRDLERCCPVNAGLASGDERRDRLNTPQGEYFTMPSSVKMKTLLETGVHFGHRTQKWNPKMAPFIFTHRNGIHIIDLQQTLVNLNAYYDLVRDTVRDGGTVLFVGTKRQAQEIIAQEAERCGMPYVNQRWLGGTLTNWRTIRERIDTLKKLEKRRDAGEFDLVTKKEALVLERKIQKLQLRLGGIREMKRLPDIVIIVDTKREATAVKESNILDIPVMAIVDTNCDPDDIDYIIPANDDAMRAIKLLVSTFASAVLEGKAMRKPEDDEEDVVEAIDVGAYGDELVEDEELLGASTLAKLRDTRLFPEEEEEDDADDELEATGEVEEPEASDDAEESEATADVEQADANEDVEQPEVSDQAEEAEEAEATSEAEQPEASDAVEPAAVSDEDEE